MTDSNEPSSVDDSLLILSLHLCSQQALHAGPLAISKLDDALEGLLRSYCKLFSGLPLVSVRNLTLLEI